MLIRTDVAFKGISYVSVPFLQRLCVEFSLKRVYDFERLFVTFTRCKVIRAK